VERFDRVLEACSENAEEDHEDLQQRNVDDNSSERLGSGSEDMTAAVESASQEATCWDGGCSVDLVEAGAADEVPEEFTPEEAPDACPNEVNASAERDKTSPLVPEEYAHDD